MKINRKRLEQIIQEEVAAANRRDSSLREEIDTCLTEYNTGDDRGPVIDNYGKDRGKATLRPMDVFNRGVESSKRQEQGVLKSLEKHKSQTPQERTAAQTASIRKSDKPIESKGLGPFDYLPPAAYGGKGIAKLASRFIEPAVGYAAGKLETGIDSMAKKNRKYPVSLSPFSKKQPKQQQYASLEENRLDQIIQEEYEKLLQERATEYVWGVKAPYHRTANQYELSVLNHDILKEKGKHHDMACG